MQWMIQKLKFYEANTLNHMNSHLYLKAKNLYLSFIWISPHFLFILKSFQHYIYIQTTIWFTCNNCIQIKKKKNFHLPRFNYQITIINQLPQKVIKEEEQQTLKNFKLQTRKRLDNLQINLIHGVQSAGKTGKTG